MRSKRKSTIRACRWPSRLQGCSGRLWRRFSRGDRVYIPRYTSVYRGMIQPMAMSIKSLDVERLARQVAAKTGESLTGAIHKALEERMGRLEEQEKKSLLLAQLEEIVHRVDQLPVRDNRAPDELMGYDQDGLPS